MTRRRAAGRWWRRRSLAQARLGLALVAVLGLLCGVGFGAVLLPGGPVGGAAGGPPGEEWDESDATPFGPVGLVLPEGLGPWVPVPAARMDEVRVAASTGSLVLDGAWGAVAPDDVLLTVMTAPAGAHGGVASVTGPFDAGRLDPPWPGDVPHRAGTHVVDGVREGVLALEAPDAHLVILSLSGPTDVLDAATVTRTLRTVRLTSRD